MKEKLKKLVTVLMVISFIPWVFFGLIGFICEAFGTVAYENFLRFLNISLSWGQVTLIEVISFGAGVLLFVIRKAFFR